MSDCPANARRKRALKHERQSYRPHFDVALAKEIAKEIMNKLRLRTNTEDETRKQFLKEDILKAVEQHAGDLIMTRTGAKVLGEVLKNWESCAASILTGIESNGLEIFDHPIGFRSVKNLLLSKHPGALPAAFWGKYSDRISEGLLNSARGALVVAALVKSSLDARADLMKDKALKKLLEQKIKNENEKETSVYGYEILLARLNKAERRRDMILGCTEGHFTTLDDADKRSEKRK